MYFLTEALRQDLSRTVDVKKFKAACEEELGNMVSENGPNNFEPSA